MAGDGEADGLVPHRDNPVADRLGHVLCVLVGARALHADLDEARDAFAMALFAHQVSLPPEWRLFAITGFLGGLTTFSTFSAEVVMQLHQGRPGWALATAALHLAGSFALTALGIDLTHDVRPQRRDKHGNIRRVRQAVRQAFGPMPPRTPLNAAVTGRDEDALARVASLVEDLREMPNGADLVPDGFDELWDVVWQVHLEGLS